MAMSGTGQRGSSRAPDEQHEQQRDGERERRRVDPAEPATNDASSARTVSPSDVGTPVTLPSWLTIMMTGDPGHVADQHRLGQQVGEEAEPAGSRASRHSRADRERQPAASARSGPGRPAASGATATAVISAVVDSGPTDSCRDEPSTA